MWDEVRVSIPTARTGRGPRRSWRRHPAYHALLPRAERQNTSAQRPFRSDATETIPRELKDAGIPIAFPTMTVDVARTGDGPQGAE